MYLNTLKPAKGAKKQRMRVGRGIACGNGKTCGRGHKGQKARSGYSRKTGFEGGQLPLQRRIPKFGFRSMAAKSCAEIRLNELEKVDAKTITFEELRKANLVDSNTKSAKVILSGKITKPVSLSGIAATAGAKKAIEAVGGKVD